MRVPNRWTRLPVLIPILLLSAWGGAHLYGVGNTTLRHLEQVVEPELERQLGRDVAIGRIYVSGLRRVVVEDLVIPDGKTLQSGTLVRVPRAYLDFGLLDLLRRRNAPAAAVSSLRIEDPELHLVRSKSGEWNVSDLLQVRTKRPVWKDFRGRLTISGGRVSVRDHGAGAGKGPVATKLSDVTLSVDAGPFPRVQVRLSAGAGSALRRVAVSGRYDLDRRDLDLRADFDGADLPFWQRYSGAASTLPARSGKADGHLRVTMKSGGETHVEGEARAKQVVMTPSPLREPLVAETLTIGFDGPKLTLNGEGRAGRAPVSVTGSLLLRDKDTLLDLRLRAPRLVEADALKAIRDWPSLPGVVWDAPADLQAHVTGSSNAWSAKVEGRLPRVRARGFVFSDLRADLAYHRALRLVVVRSAQAGVAGGTVRATGRVDVKPTPSRIAFQGVAENVDLAQLPLMASAAKQGMGRVRFQAAGPVDNVHTTFTATASGIRLGPARFRQATAQIDLPWEGDVTVRARASGIEPAEKGGPLPAAESGSATIRVADNGRIQINAGQLVVAGQTVRVSGSATEAGALDLRLAASGADVGRLARTLGQEGVSGRGDISARLTGTMDQPRVSGQVALGRGKVQQLGFAGLQAQFDLASTERGSVRFSVKDARAGGFPLPIRTASGKADLDGETLRLSNLRVELPQGSVTADGKVSLEGALDLALKASGLDLKTVARAAGLGNGTPVGGVASFDGRVAGRLDAPRLSGDVVVTNGAVRGMRFTDLRARVEADSDGLVARNVALRRGQESVTLSGRVEAHRGRPVVVDARVQAAALDMGEALRALGFSTPITGLGRVDLQVRGAYPDVAVAGDFDVRGAVLAGVPVERLSGRLRGPQSRVGGAGSLGTQAITIEEVVLQDGRARVAASGSIRPGGQIALDLQGTAVPLERFNRFVDPYARLAGDVSFSGSVKGSLSQPLVAVEVNAPAVQVNGRELGAVAGDIGYAGGSIELSGLTVAQGQALYRIDRGAFRGEDGTLSLEASVKQADLARLDAILRSIPNPPTPLPRGEGGAGGIGQLRQRLEALPKPMRGRLDGSVSLSGRIPGLEGRAQFALTQAAVGELNVQRLAGNASWSPRESTLKDGVLVADGVDLSGSLQWGADGRLTTEVHLRETQVEALRALALKAASLDPAVAVGRGLRPAPDGLRPAPDGLRPAPDGLRPAPGMQFGAALREAVAGLPEPFAGVVTGDAALQGRRGALDGYARIQVAGAVVGEARFRNAGATVRWDRGSMAADDIAIRADGVDVRGSFRRSAGGQLALQLNLGQTEVAAARDLARAVASVGKAYRGGRFLPASLPAMLEDLPEPLEGSLSGSFSLAGKPGGLRGSVNARADRLRLGESGITTISAEGTWSPEGWSFPALAVVGEKCALAGSIAMGPGDQISGEISTRNGCLEGLRAMASGLSFLHQSPNPPGPSSPRGRGVGGLGAILARVDALPTPLSGDIEGTMRFSGALMDPEVHVALTGTDLVAGTYRLAGLTADADVRGGIVTVRDLAVRTNGGQLTARGRVDLDGPMDLTVAGTDFSLDALGPLVPKGRKLTGHVDLSATIKGTTDIPEAEARIVVHDADIGGMRFARIEANGVRLSERRVDLGRVEVQQDKIAGTISGSVPFRWDPLEIPTDEPIQLSVSLPEFDFSTEMLSKDQSTGIEVAGTPEMRPLLDAVETASGKVVADLVVTGTLREPNMDGKIALRGGQLKLASLESGLKDVDARLRLEGPWVIVEQFQARSDRGGTVTAAGRAGVRAKGDQSLDVRFHADRFQVAVRDIAGVHGLGLKGTTSGDVALIGRLTEPVLAGKLQLSQAQFSVPAEITPRLQRPPQTLFDPALDIDVQVGDGSWVRRGNAISALVTAGVGVRGKYSSPVVQGRATVERGDLRYAGISFRLQPGGSVSFSYDTPGALVARLNLTADTRIRAASPATGERRRYVVTMHLTGAIPNVNVAVSSDPPDLPQYRLMAILSRTDQFEALAKGEGVESVLRDQVAEIVAGAVLPQVFEPIEEGLAEALGLDEVNFDYGFDRPLRVDARKEVLPRVFVSYNRDMGQGQFVDSAEQWSVTYRVYQRLYVGWRRDATGNKDRLVLEGTFKF